jgi:general secretion pathway protein D
VRANVQQFSSAPTKLLGRVLLSSALALLGSCAMVRTPVQEPSPASAAPQPAVATQADVAAATASIPEIAAAPSDNGINRDGRVFERNRYAEDAPTGTNAPNEVVELNFEQEDLRVVIEQLGDALGITMVIDPTIDYKVSLRTSPNNPLRYQDIWPLLRMLTRNAGVTVEQAGNIWRFSRSPANIPTEIVLPGSLNSATSSEVLQVTPLKYIAVEALEPIITPMLQPVGSVLRLGPANLIGLIGTPEQLARVNALLAVVDDDPFQNQGIHLYTLQNSPAESVAEELTNVIKLIEGEQSSYQVLGLDRINAVLVLAPANRGFKEIDRWVGILDAASQEQVEQLFVYKVKNLDAVKLGETLSEVFGNEDEEEENARANREQVLDANGVVLAGATAQPAQPNNPAANLANRINDLRAGILGLPQEGVSADITVTIVADEDTNSLLVRATPREYRQLLATISSLDSLPLQVMINAVIGQVTLSDSNNFGIDWSRVSSNLSSGPARLSTRFLPKVEFATNGAPVAGSGLVLTKTFTDGAALIDSTLQAIAKDNNVKLLARPMLLAANNQEGEIIVGQAVPVNGSTQTALGGVTTQSISYRDVGIVLKITPQINDDGYINMKIEQSLSSVQENAGTTVGNNPTFINQEITTTAVVEDQSAVVLGGLIQEENADNQTGVPLLQKLPILGRAFSYNQLSNSRRELFIILRPQIIYGDERDGTTQQEIQNSFTEVSRLLKDAGLLTP